MSSVEFILKEGIKLLISKNYKFARENFNQALQINPNSAEAYILRGGAEYKLGNTEAAIADYTQARQINPRAAEAYFFRASVLNEVGNIQLAIADYAQACLLHSSLTAVPAVMRYNKKTENIVE